MRKVGLLFVLLALLTMSGLVSAQDGSMVFCSTLAEGDCNILKQSQTAMMGLTSASVDLSIDFNMTGVPQAPPIALSLSGTGAFHSAGMTGEMPTDAAAMAAKMQENLKAFQGQLDLTLNVPADLAMMMGSQEAMSIPLNLRMVDGIGYLDFDSISSALGPQAASLGLPAGWGGIDVGQLISLAMAQSASSGMSPQMLMNPGSIPAEMQELTKYITVTRAADSTAADGAPVAVFNTTVDLGGLISDPALMQLMQSQAGADAQMPSAEEMAMAQSAMKALSITATQSIGTSDGFVRSMELNISADLSAMGAATGDSSVAGNFSLVFKANLSNFNNAPAIEAPANAQIAPLESLMGAMMGGGMSQ